MVAQLRAAAARAAEREAAERARAARAAQGGRAQPPRRAPAQVARGAPIQVGGLGWPLSGSLLAGFGARMPDGRNSSGVLIAAAAGTPVQAVADGTVVFAEWMTGYGLIVIVDHGNDHMSLYAHNESLLCQVGDRVSRGDPVASVGSSGGRAAGALLRAAPQRPADRPGQLAAAALSPQRGQPALCGVHNRAGARARRASPRIRFTGADDAPLPFSLASLPALAPLHAAEPPRRWRRRTKHHRRSGDAPTAAFRCARSTATSPSIPRSRGVRR